MSNPQKRNFEDSRRGFIRGSSLLLAGAIPGSRLQANPVIQPPAETGIRIGLVGCGYRGISVASQALGAASAGRVELTALADVFPDRLQQALRSLKGRHPDRVLVDSDTRFVGLESFRQLLESDVDLVLLCAPPAFRPLHFEAAVNAGKHVYAEKPIATDAPGVRRFLEAYQSACHQQRIVATGLTRRCDAAYCQTIEQLRGGAIGQIVFARAYGNTCGPHAKHKQPDVRRKSQSELDFQLRNWKQFRWASGDSIVEQHVQNLDIINWLVGDHPREAQGTGGRQPSSQQSLGDVFDHHTVEYTYPGGLRMLSMCRQSTGCWNSVSQWAHGTKGWCDISGGKIYDLRNRLIWRTNSEPSDKTLLFQDLANAVAQAVASRSVPTFEDSNSPAVFQNWGRFAAESTMTAIMGRMASYSGNLVAWDDCFRSQSSLADVDGLRRLGDPAPALPAADGSYNLPVPGSEQFKVL